MGRWDYRNIGLSAKEDSNLLQQFLECLGAGEINASKDPSDLDCGYGIVMNYGYDMPDALDIYYIASRLFTDTKLGVEESIGNTFTDYEDTSFDEYIKTNDGIINNHKYRQYDYETGTVFYGQDLMDVVNWDDIKPDCEEQAKDADIEVDWINRDEKTYPNPENEEFYEFCSEYVHDNISLEEAGTEETTEKIDAHEIDTNIVSEVISKAKALGYFELVDLIKEKIG